MSLPRLARTLTHLKGSQLLAQVRHRVRTRLEDPARVRTAVPEDGERAPVRAGFRDDVELLHPDAVPVTVEGARAGRFTLLGATHELGRPIRWRDEGATRLWRYHLQDFGFLHGLGFELGRELTLEYLEAQPPGRGAEGWEPYPLSLRLGNLTLAFYGSWAERTRADEALDARLWLELRRMAHWLEGHTETHLLGNHLLENAIALCLFGARFEDPAARRAEARGRALLRACLEDQVLADGGHVERSPMYQQRLLWGLGALLASGDAALRESVEPLARRMLDWLAHMTHPDGGIALFNDAALDVYPPTEALARWLGALTGHSFAEPGPGAQALEASGYFVARNADGDALVLDAGAIGPDHQPGHAHADFLSIELSLAGRRFVVDGGNPTYEASPERAWARGVAAHSTVFLEGHEPLELWGAFRVGRRGRPCGVTHRVDEARGELEVRAGHSGYAHLAGAPVPERRVRWRAAGELTLEDRVDARVAHPCVSQLRVDGGWSAERRGADRVRFRREGIEAWVIADGELELVPDRSFPRFYEEAPAHLLRRRFEASTSGVRWRLGRASVLEREA